MRVLRTGNRDVWRNLAVEEWLLDRAEAFGPTLFLYRNDPAIVLGKNQNPWAEADLDRARHAGVRIARRASGGGAVYHDAGNLNYAFIVPRDRYDTAAQFGAVVRALASLNLVATLENRTSLAIGDRKISGNAFCLKARVALHHGTLLVRSELDRMSRLLKAVPAEFEGHAVPSVPAPVVNLVDLNREVTPERVEQALVESALGLFGGPLDLLADEEVSRWDWEDLYRRHASWEWVYGRTPPFRLCRAVCRDRRPAGRVIVTVEEGVIRDMVLDPAGADAGSLAALAAAARGLRFDLPTLDGLFAGHPDGWSVGTD